MTKPDAVKAVSSSQDTSDNWLKSIHRIVWVSVWRRRRRLRIWKFKDVTFAEAVSRTKHLMVIEWAIMEISLVDYEGKIIKSASPAALKNLFGQGVEFCASNKYLHACTKRAFAVNQQMEF